MPYVWQVDGQGRSTCREESARGHRTHSHQWKQFLYRLGMRKRIMQKNVDQDLEPLLESALRILNKELKACIEKEDTRRARQLMEATEDITRALVTLKGGSD